MNPVDLVIRKAETPDPRMFKGEALSHYTEPGIFFATAHGQDPIASDSISAAVAATPQLA